MFALIYDLFGYNKAIFLCINYITKGYFISYFFLVLSKIFEFYNFIFYYIAIIIYFMCKMVSNLNRIEFNRWYCNVFRLGFSYVVVFFVYFSIKYTTNMPRPYCSLLDIEYYSVHDFKNERCFSSFPSAHVSLAILLYNFFMLYTRNIILRCLFLFTVLLVGISRISLAMHFPSDIIYSCCITYIILFLVRYLTSILYSNKFFISVRDYCFIKLLGLS
jgi:membrane-associated phospholipid phosphatase